MAEGEIMSEKKSLGHTEWKRKFDPQWSFSQNS